MKVAAIVPAYNEEQRICRVLSVVEQAPLVDEVWVVNDGSTDRTAEVIPRDNGVRTLHLPRNVGKGGALLAGANTTDAEVLVFVDADLVGLTPDHVDELVRPVLADEADMSVGVFRGGRYWTDLAQRLVPNISGQRAIKREIFLSVPRLDRTRYGVEVAMTRHLAVSGKRVAKVPLFGVTHVMKEEKLGLPLGVLSRLRMYRDMCTCMLYGLLFDRRLRNGHRNGNGHGAGSGV